MLRHGDSRRSGILHQRGKSSLGAERAGHCVMKTVGTAAPSTKEESHSDSQRQQRSKRSPLARRWAAREEQYDALVATLGFPGFLGKSCTLVWMYPSVLRLYKEQ